MRRFDVIPITSEFSENPNVRVTTLCSVPILGYIYAGTNVGDIILYKYNDLDRLNMDGNASLAFVGIDRERMKWREEAIRVRNVSQKCKQIDKLLPIVSYDTVLDDDTKPRLHIGGVIMCLCEGNLFYVDIRLKERATLLCKGVSCVSVWKDSYGISGFQTKFCVSTKKKIVFYNVCILGDLEDIEEIIEEDNERRGDGYVSDRKFLKGGLRTEFETRNMGRGVEKDNSERRSMCEEPHTQVKMSRGSPVPDSSYTSWFGFSMRQKTQKSFSSANTDDQILRDSNNEEALGGAEGGHAQTGNVEFIKVEELPIPSRLTSFSEKISKIEWCDDWIFFVLGNTYFAMNMESQKINEILNVDQVGDKFVYQIVVLPEKEFMLTCQDNLGVFFNFNTLEPSPKPMIQWPSEGLTGIVPSEPYLLGGTKSGVIQIYCLGSASSEETGYREQKEGSLEFVGIPTRSDSRNSGTRKGLGGNSQNRYSVQTLQLDDEITCISTSCTCEGTLSSFSTKTVPAGPLVLVSTISKIYLLVPIPIEESVFELVSRNQRKQVFSLIDTYCSNNELLYNSLLFKTRCLMGWFEFGNLNFKSAFGYFEEAHVDPRVILVLFWKDLIPPDAFEEVNVGIRKDDIYEYASSPCKGSKRGLSEDLTPDLKYHESILRSLFRINKQKALAVNIREFVLSMLSYKSEHVGFNTGLGDTDKIENLVHTANECLKLFVLCERNRYPTSLNGKQDSCGSTGKILDVAYLKLIVRERNEHVNSSKKGHRDGIDHNNSVVLSLLDPNCNHKAEGNEKRDSKNLILTEFDLEKYEDFLISNGRCDILSALLSHRLQFSRSLEILEGLLNFQNSDCCNSNREEMNRYAENDCNKSDSGLINIHLIMYKTLYLMCFSDTIPMHVQANFLKRYSRYVLDKQDVPGIEDLFTIKPVEKYPLTVDEVLGLFSQCGKKLSDELTKSYLEKIISTQTSSIQVKYKVTLIEIYISDIYGSEPPSVSAGSVSNDTAEHGGLSDVAERPVSDYDSLFTDRFKPSKLLLMLEEMDGSDIECLFDHIIYDEKMYKHGVHEMIVVEYILLLFKCNKHKEALSYIVNVLGNIELAEIYAIVWSTYFKHKEASLNTQNGIDACNLDENNKAGTTDVMTARVLFFSEFGFWRKRVRNHCEFDTLLGESRGVLSSWMDVLDLSHNELSLVARSFRNADKENGAERSESTRSSAAEKQSPSTREGFFMNANEATRCSESLIVLIKTLVDAWRSNDDKAEMYQDSTLRLLRKYSLNKDLDFQSVLQIIPDEWPLLSLVDFLKKSFVKSIYEGNVDSVSTNLSAISYLRFHEKLSSLKSNHITITQDMICNVCSLKLGNKQCALYPNGVCIHTHCLSNEPNPSGCR